MLPPAHPLNPVNPDNAWILRLTAANWQQFHDMLIDAMTAWHQLESELTSSSAIDSNPQAVIDELGQRLHAEIMYAANAAIPKKQVNAQSKHWWSKNKDIPKLLDEYHRAARYYSRHKHDA